jgi:signal transduction histidine kinase
VILPREQLPYFGLGLLAALLALHWSWCWFVAYPIAFERQLKRGKPWVYIPMRWRGGRKLRILFFSRVLLLAIVALGVALAGLLTRRAEIPWLFAYFLILGFAVLRLNALWLAMRYRQQEDSYYFLHDELRTKLEGEGKDMAESAFKSLAAYQHQNLLRKADEKGELLKTLRAQARTSRKYRKEARSREPVET